MKLQKNSAARRERITSSTLWAAYGDALGFITELADLEAVKRRVRSSSVRELVPWKRRVGGRFGVDVRIPQGGYSDDTQLRLSTCRAIRGDGVFDVETFAKVELPVWLAYCLGAGRGSKAAAANLSNRRTNWFSNFFSTGNSSYISGGGNGAAMRIQPHVWSALDYSDWGTFLPQVAQNALCTHGHMRGIGGALIHAVSLASVLDRGVIPPISEWRSYSSALLAFKSIVEQDKDLAQFWLPVWEERASTTLDAAISDVVIEWEDACRVAEEIGGSAESMYVGALEALGGFDPSERGSGLKSAIFSLLAANMIGERGASGALALVVNMLGSDTDTIATMAGALIGAVDGQAKPAQEVQDQWYLEHEAERCYSISQGGEVSTFSYPDLLYWNPPKSPLSAVGLVDGHVTIAGLGRLYEAPNPESYQSKDAQWSWYGLPFGQSILCKHRKMLDDLDDSVMPTAAIVQKREPARATNPSKSGSRPKGDDLFERVQAGSFEASLDQLIHDATRSGFDPAVIGGHLKLLASRPNGLELVVAYAAVIAKALAGTRTAR